MRTKKISVSNQANRLIHFVAVLFALTTLSSCFPKVYVHPFEYPDQDNKFVVNKSFDEVWDNVIDFFASNNIKIQTIEKNSGIIYTYNSKFSSSYWFNDKKRLGNPSAFIAVQYSTRYKKDGTGLHTYASWNVRVKKIDDNKTQVSINIADPQVKVTEAIGDITRRQLVEVPVDLQAKSTGAFEKLLFKTFSK